MAHEKPSQSTEADGFLQRWSRRKSAARREPAETAPPREPRPVPHSDPPKTDADMPPLESLGEGSDLSEFFSAGVSEDLRRLALRRVFGLARFNVVDGLDDYAEDYTAFRPLGDRVTAGLRWHRERLAAREASEPEQNEPQACACERQPDADPPRGAEPTEG